MPGATGRPRPAGTTWPNLPNLSSGHTYSRQRSGRPPVSISYQPFPRESFQNPAAEAEPTDVKSVDKKVSHCLVHEGKELELYCETCGELICTWCALKGGEHQTHHYEKLNQAFEKYEAEIACFLGPMEKQVTVTAKALAQLDARCGEISDQQTTTAVSIHTTFRRLREVLDVRETELIGQLDLETQVKLKGLAAQRDQIETTLAQLHSCLHFMRESLRTGNEGDVLMMKANTLTQVEELTTPFQSDILEPNAKADVRFSASADMPAVCRNYGQVFSPGSPDPSRCHITGKGAEFTVQVGERSTAILQAINFEGKPCEEPIMKSLDCVRGSRHQSKLQSRGKRTGPVQDQLPAHRQGETPATHQSPRPARQGEPISCSSEVTSRETGHSNPNYRWGEGTLWNSDQPEGGGGGC